MMIDVNLQLKLTQAFFLGGKFGKGQKKKLSSKSGLDFSKRGFTTSSYNHCQYLTQKHHDQ
jgi:hypothetical protein